MKRILLFFLLIAFLVVAMAGLSAAQSGGKQYMAGCNYDSEDGVLASYGIMGYLDDNFYILGYGNNGEEYSSANAELIYYFSASGIFDKLKNLYVGPILGLNSDWEGSTGKEAINYITGAAGVTASYKFADNFGILSYYKWKTSFNKDDAQESRGVVNVSFWIRI